MKRKLISLLLAISLAGALLAGCNSGEGTQSSSGTTGTPSSEAAADPSSAAEDQEDQAPAKPTVDREGTPIDVPDEVNRIISTAPSNTEVLVGLGLADKLVMVDTYSVDTVEGLPEDVLSVNFREPDAEALISADPDLMIVSGHNRTGDEDPYKLVKEAGICVAYIPSSNSVEGILEDMRFIGALTGANEEAEQMVSDFQAQVDEIRAIGDTVTEKKTVYFEIGSGSSLYSFGKGTFLNEFVELVGAANIFGEEEGWISPSPEAILAANPDVIITNEDYMGEEAVNAILNRDGWDAVKAVQNGEVYLVDSDESSRASQNSIKALRAIAKAIYPDLYE